MYYDYFISEVFEFVIGCFIMIFINSNAIFVNFFVYSPQCVWGIYAMYDASDSLLKVPPTCKFILFCIKDSVLLVKKLCSTLKCKRLLHEKFENLVSKTCHIVVSDITRGMKVDG